MTFFLIWENIYIYNNNNWFRMFSCFDNNWYKSYKKKLNICKITKISYKHLDFLTSFSDIISICITNIVVFILYN